MVLFTTSLPTQNQAGSAGTYFYPQLMQIKQYSVVGDQMQRDQVTPTGAIQLYSTVSGTGTPTLTMAAQKSMNLTTTNTTNDNAATRTQAFAVNRVVPPQLDSRSTITFDIFFNTSVQANCQYFIGWVDSASNLTALPTTTRHLGVYVDTSVSSNWKLSSADGTSQVTTDTSHAVSTSEPLRLNIVWSGDNTAVISLYNGTYPNFTTLLKSVNVTSVLAATSNRALEHHIFAQTLTTAAIILTHNGWSVSAT